MLFRNLSLYRLPDSWSIAPADLEESLSRRPLRPCGSFDMQTRGWVPCSHDRRFLHSQGGQHLLALGVDQKLLPASVVNQVAKDRAVDLAEQQGHPVGRRQMRELRARVADELRARALTRRRTTSAWLDLRRHWLVVNSPGAGRAEELVETLRECLGSVPVRPLDTRRSPAGTMAAWLNHGDAAGRFAIDQDLDLQAIDGGGATIRYVHHPLEKNAIRAHLAAGKLPVRLGLTWNDRIAFVLHQNLQIRRVKFLDVYKDDNTRGENASEQFDIDFALMTGELSLLLEELLGVLGGEQGEPVSRAA